MGVYLDALEKLSVKESFYSEMYAIYVLHNLPERAKKYREHSEATGPVYLKGMFNNVDKDPNKYSQYK